jgi:acetate kinase
MKVLSLNSGSSSLKFGVYQVQSTHVEMLVEGTTDSIGGAYGTFSVRGVDNEKIVAESGSFANQNDAIIRIERLLAEPNMPQPDAVGHRVVHGGPTLRQHCLIDDSVLQRLKEATIFAPLHAPLALSVIGFARAKFPALPHVACFDTTFHAAMPDVARVLAIPKSLQQEGIQRYGFHGLSLESIMQQLDGNLPKRVVVAHLGNGASVSAIRDGKSIDTSMGLTPTGGAMMGTRSGDLDPGVLIYLMREKQFDARMLSAMVDHRSGMLGVSGISSDMRRLHDAAPANADARLAIEMFCYSVRKQVAAMIAVLDGVDLLVFTGGIGENDAQVRAAICRGLSFAGVSLDENRNRIAPGPVSNATSRCAVHVLPSQEDRQIARHTAALVARRLTGLGRRPE